MEGFPEGGRTQERICEDYADCLGAEGDCLFGCQAPEIRLREKDKAFIYSFVRTRFLGVKIGNNLGPRI